MHQEQQQLVCGNSIKIMNKKLCILDIETTGFEPEDSEILELYILKVVNEKVVDEFYSLLNPVKKLRTHIFMELLMKKFKMHHFLKKWTKK